jgi:membrane protease YdiL (CAAX protease family)
MQPEDRNLVAVFVLTFLWSWAFWVPDVLAARGIAAVPRQSGHIAPFGPTVAAFALTFLTRGRAGVTRLAKRGVDTGFGKRWLVPIVLLFPAINGGILLVGWLTGRPIPALPWTGQPVSIPIAFVYIFLLAGPLQEEFGWRGYALDRLEARWSALGASLVLGVIWAAWHLPLFLFSETAYYRPENVWGFVLSTVLVAILITWIYNNTGGSVLATMLVHASFNFSHWAFPVLETEFSRTYVVPVVLVVTLGVVVRWGPNTLVRGRGREWLHESVQRRLA